MGGGQSVGIDAISSELDTISSTLSTIEAELGPNGAIVQALERLQCSETAGLIESEPASVINAWYSKDSNYLTNPKTFSPGEIALASTDVTTLYGWANGVIQGNVNQAPLSVSAVLDSLHDLGVPGVTAGAIHDCVKASGNPPANGTLDLVCAGRMLEPYCGATCYQDSGGGRTVWPAELPDTLSKRSSLRFKSVTLHLRNTASSSERLSPLA